MSLRPAVAEQCRLAGLDPVGLERVVIRALAEDLRYGPDITTEATVAARALATADVVARQAGVFAGGPVALAVFDVAGLDPGPVTGLVADGARIWAGTTVMTIEAPLAGLLGAERTLLNLLTHLSGIATTTRAWVERLNGTGCAVRDTRKTTPGLRDLEKYAVRSGGGVNHRMGLGDAALVKDNHVIAAGGIRPAVDAIRRLAPTMPLEVECDNLAQVEEAVAAGVELILLDNMTIDDIAAAVALVAARARPDGSGRVRLEASGGLRLDTARAVAETGVDFLAVGALTHSSPALDLGLDLRPL